MGMNDINSLSHTSWNCKYHIVFAPKYRRKVFYKEKRAAVGKILRELCEWKGVKILEAEACPNHIHLYVEIPPKRMIRSPGSFTSRKQQPLRSWPYLRSGRVREEHGRCLPKQNHPLVG